jgi:hypothetical protein
MEPGIHLRAAAEGKGKGGLIIFGPVATESEEKTGSAAQTLSNAACPRGEAAPHKKGKTLPSQPLQEPEKRLDA